MIEQMIEYMRKYLVTGQEFEKMLDDVLQEEYHGKVKIQYTLFNKEGQVHEYGEGGEGEPASQYKRTYEDGYNVLIKLWQSSDELCQSICEALFDEYWNRGFCDSVCGLPATDRGGFVEKCNYTIEKWRREGKHIACIMLDLDNFKEVNTEYGHTVGTEVISEFSRVVFASINKKGILIHQSGDEFDLLFSYDKYTEVMELMYATYVAVSSHQFAKAPNVKLTMAIGVWLVGERDENSFEMLRTKAENIYDPKVKNGVKQRNSIRIGQEENSIYSERGSYKVGALRVVGNVYNEVLFHNIFLDYISLLVSKIEDMSQVQKSVDEYLLWINPTYVATNRVTIVCDRPDTVAEVSYVDIAFASLQGLLKNDYINEVDVKIAIGSKEVKLFVNDCIVLQYSNVEMDEEMLWETEKYHKSPKEVDVRKTVLVQAGYTTEAYLPEDIFYRVVRVDARPSIGGGLPDFWAATLAALITNMVDNENFNNIAIFGDMENIKCVKQYLADIEEWTEDKMKYISKKTYKPYSDVLKFQQRYSKHINTFSNIIELTNHVFEQSKGTWIVMQRTEKELHNNSRFMKRILSYEKMQLEITDGFKTDTIAHAFPIALEILKNSNRQDKIIVDQAGRELLELTDFKILLMNPKLDKLPEYYYYDQKEMDRYYEDIFINKDGLFRIRLEKGNQLDELVNHVKTTVSGKSVYATRRAILVVPNEIQVGSSYSPLGLVAIWLAPRFGEGNVIIDYSYTWRTVEAIVGLPLSMYASVRFSEYLTKKIEDTINNPNMEIKMGTVSYIAHSLHMFTDEESMNIVRGIINEVSN